jgi:hypothetical protein
MSHLSARSDMNWYFNALLGRLALVAAFRITNAAEGAAGIILFQKPLDLGREDRRAFIEAQHFMLYVDAPIDFLGEQCGPMCSHL